VPLLAERALRAEPVPVAAASLCRRRPQDSSGVVSPALWLSPRPPQRGDPKTAQFQERCAATRRRAGLIGSGIWRSSGWCGIATRSTEDRNSTSFEAARCGLGHGPQRGQACARPGCRGNFPPAHRRFAPRTGLSSGRPLRGLRRSSHRSNTKTRPGAIEPRPSEPVRFVVYGHQRRSCHFPERALPSCHWLSEPCERSQCEAACGRMDNNLTLAALAELLLRYRPRLDGSLRPVPPNHFRCKPFHSIATEPLILSCRPSLECSCATFLSEPCERLVWHRDQVDRRPQFNEFRGGQMRPRPRAAKRPSVCSAWVSGQFSPSTSSLRSSYWAFFGPPSSRATEVISP
jgi:hypothetical protein